MIPKSDAHYARIVPHPSLGGQRTRWPAPDCLTGRPQGERRGAETAWPVAQGEGIVNFMKIAHRRLVKEACGVQMVKIEAIVQHKNEIWFSFYGTDV